MHVISIYHRLPRFLRLFFRECIQIIRIIINSERRFVTLDHYISNNPQVATFIYNESNTLFSSTPRYNHSEESIVHPGLTICGGVLKFESASCFANSDIIQFPNGTLWYELRDLYHSIKKKCNCCDGVVMVNDEKCWYETKQFKKTIHLEKGFFLSGIYSSNYYHFILAVLPKLRWINYVPDDVPILIDRSVEKYESYKQLVNYCNTENRPLLFLDRDIRYEVKELYYATTQMMAQPNYRSGQQLANDDDLYNMAAMDFVRTSIMKNNINLPSSYKRVFISRKNASGLRQFNEDECIEALKPLGFEVVYPESLSLLEQVAIFYHSECIVGGSGAAFANLLFASDMTNVIILEGYKSGICIFSTIANYVHSNLLYMYDKSFGVIPNGDYIHSDFKVDVDELCEFVRKILSNNG